MVVATRNLWLRKEKKSMNNTKINMDNSKKTLQQKRYHMRLEPLQFVVCASNEEEAVHKLSNEVVPFVLTEDDISIDKITEMEA